MHDWRWLLNIITSAGKSRATTQQSEGAWRAVAMIYLLMLRFCSPCRPQFALIFSK